VAEAVARNLRRVNMNTLVLLTMRALIIGIRGAPVNSPVGCLTDL
jgi:hypothetical protein